MSEVFKRYFVLITTTWRTQTQTQAQTHTYTTMNAVQRLNGSGGVMNSDKWVI